MSLNLYDTTIPVLKIYLRNLLHILTVGEDYFNVHSASFDPNTARLIDDMYSLSQQVRCACRAAQNIPLLVLGEKITGSPPSDTEEPTLEALKSRILATLDFVDGNGQGESKDGKRFGREAFHGAESFEVTWLTYKLTGMVYVTHYALPNFFFHVVTAYDILRARGVDLGKGDFAMGTANPQRQQQS